MMPPLPVPAVPQSLSSGVRQNVNPDGYPTFEWNLPSGLLSQWCSGALRTRLHRLVQSVATIPATVGATLATAARTSPTGAADAAATRNPRCTSLVARQVPAAGRNAGPSPKFIRVLRLPIV